MSKYNRKSRKLQPGVNMDSSLKAKLTQINIIVAVSKRYFALLDKYLIGTDPVAHSQLQNDITRAEALLLKLSAGFGRQIYSISPGDAAAINDIYSELDELQSLTEHFAIMVNSKTYGRLLAQELSTGKHADTQMDLAKFKTARETLAGVGEEPLVAALSSMTAESARGFHRFIIDVASVQPTFTKFSLEVCRKLLTTLTPSFRGSIVEVLASQQERALGAKIVDTSGCVGHAGMIYNTMIPGSKLMPISELFQLLKWDYDPELDPVGNFTAEAIANHIVVVDNSTPTVVQFDFTGVLNLAKVTKIPEFSGLTQTYLKRYNVVEEINTVRNNGSPVAIYSALGTVREKYHFVPWYVVEKLGDLYRILIPADAQGYQVSGKDIQHYFGQVSNADTMYNNILSQVSMKINRADMFDPRAKIFIDQYRSSAQAKSASGPIKDKIIDIMRGYVDAAVTSVGSAAEFSQMFSSRNWLAAILKTCTSVLSTENKLLARFDSAEYLVSVLAKIDKIVEKFLKAIKRFSADERPPDRMFTEYARDQIIRDLEARAMNVLIKAANDVDRDSGWTGGEMSLKEFVITGVF